MRVKLVVRMQSKAIYLFLEHFRGIKLDKLDPGGNSYTYSSKVYTNIQVQNKQGARSNKRNANKLKIAQCTNRILTIEYVKNMNVLQNYTLRAK